MLRGRKLKSGYLQRRDLILICLWAFLHCRGQIITMLYDLEKHFLFPAASVVGLAAENLQTARLSKGSSLLAGLVYCPPTHLHQSFHPSVYQTYSISTFSLTNLTASVLTVSVAILASGYCPQVATGEQGVVLQSPVQGLQIDKLSVPISGLNQWSWLPYSQSPAWPRGEHSLVLSSPGWPMTAWLTNLPGALWGPSYEWFWLESPRHRLGGRSHSNTGQRRHRA